MSCLPASLSDEIRKAIKDNLLGNKRWQQQQQFKKKQNPSSKSHIYIYLKHKHKENNDLNHFCVCLSINIYPSASYVFAVLLTMNIFHV